MNKKTLILGGVLIVLIALAFAYQGPLKKWQSNLGKPANFLAKIDSAKIDKLEITTGGATVVLTKQNDVVGNLAPAGSGSTPAKWKYNNSKDFFADPGIMSEALAKLNEAKTAELELVSNNQGRKSEFRTDLSGTEVKVYQGDKIAADFIIGAGTYGSSYLSTPGSPDTYSVKVDLASAFAPVEWRDQSIFSAAQEKINKIRFQYPNREFTVALTNGKWSGILPEKFTVSKEKMDKIVEIMASLKAASIPEQTFNNTGLAKHLMIIEATGEAVDNVLMVGENQGDLFYAKRGDSDNIYLINKADRDELDKWIWQLK